MQATVLSRRAFLAATGATTAGLLTNRAMATTTAPAAYPNKFQRDGGLVILPDRGELYIASDFHTRHTDFQRWLTQTKLVEKLKDRDDVYGLILGDAVDAKFGDLAAERGGDTRIIERIREIQQTLGEAGKRLIFIKGNHEYEVARIYEALQKQYGMTARTQAILVRALFNSADGAYFQQFNFLERITEEQFRFLKGLPVAVMAKNGLLAVHAGPSREAVGTTSVARQEKKVVAELVWPRAAEIDPTGYTLDDVTKFLAIMEESNLLVVGHTPLSSLPPEWVKNGVGVYGEHQMILATSFGSDPGEKSHLVIDLSKRIRGVGDLAVGREILRLEPKQG